MNINDEEDNATILKSSILCEKETNEAMKWIMMEEYDQL